MNKINMFFILSFVKIHVKLTDMLSSISIFFYFSNKIKFVVVDGNTFVSFIMT
jgi:hypothetical protein